MGSPPFRLLLLRMHSETWAFNPSNDLNSDCGTLDQGCLPTKSNAASATARPTSSYMSTVYDGGVIAMGAFSALPPSPAAGASEFMIRPVL